MSTSLSVVGRLPTALSPLNKLTHLARSVSGQWRVNRQSVCREGSPSIHTQLEQLVSANWCLPPGSLSYGHLACPPFLIQRLSRGEEIRNQIQDEQLPASQYGWHSVFIGETTVAISICNHHKAPKEKQEKAADQLQSLRSMSLQHAVTFQGRCMSDMHLGRGCVISTALIQHKSIVEISTIKGSQCFK